MSIKVRIRQDKSKAAYEHLVKDCMLVLDVDFTVQKFVRNSNIEFIFEDEKKSDAVQLRLLYG